MGIKETKKLKSVSNIKQIVIDDNDNSFAFQPSQVSPFEIGVCWKYDMIFRETKQSKNKKSQTLSVWKPKLDQSEDEKEEWFILGYLALNHGVDPNENIPILTVKSGSDQLAL